MIATATFMPERMQAAADAESTSATDLAEWLVRSGMPFRDAHAVVGSAGPAALGGGGFAARIWPQRTRISDPMPPRWSRPGRRCSATHVARWCRPATRSRHRSNVSPTQLERDRLRIR